MINREKLISKSEFFKMKSMRRTTVKNSALIILCDSSIFNTFAKIYVLRTLCDKAIFACVIGIQCCVIKHFSHFYLDMDIVELFRNIFINDFGTRWK